MSVLQQQLKDLSEEQQNLADRQIKVFWKGIPPKIMKYAELFGLIHFGWTLRDYMSHAISIGGYETICTWAERGAGKSNRLLAHGGWIYCKDKYDYEGWKLVLDRTVYKPLTFIRTLKAIPHGKRIPWLGIDDIGVHMPSTIWRTDIKTYEAVDATWAAIRTKASVIDVNIPLIDRLAKNIRDSLSFEMFMGKNQNTLIERLVRLPNIKDRLESNFRKLQVEPIHKIDFLEVPTDIFNEYWEKRLTLADEALDNLERVLTKRELQEGTEGTEDYVTIPYAAKVLGLSVSTISGYVREKVVPHRVIGGRAKIHKSDIAELEHTKAKRELRKRRGKKPT